MYRCSEFNKQRLLGRKLLAILGTGLNITLGRYLQLGYFGGRQGPNDLARRAHDKAPCWDGRPARD